MRGVDRACAEKLLGQIDFVKTGGLIPLIVQDAWNGEVLMHGYTNHEALARSIESGELWLWSRTRERLWKKGETSGNTLAIIDLFTDCDQDTIIAQVEPAGPTCHTGARSCFNAPPPLAALDLLIEERSTDPREGSYTAQLLDDRNLRLKKIGEEAAELILACAEGEPREVVEEAADLIYHTLVACRARGVSAADLSRELARRLST